MSDSGVAADYTPLDTNMEFEDLTLPRDKFSRFRHFFVVNPRFTFFLFLAPVVMIVGSVGLIMRRADDGLVGFIVLGLILSSAIVFLAFLLDENIQDITKDTRNSLSFVGEIVKFRPGLDMSKWDLIAARSNRIFHHNNKSMTPYFFYDGTDCHSYFELRYVNWSTCTVTDSDRSETEDTDVPRVNNVKKSETEKLVQPMIDEAIKVYKESLEEYWGQYTAEVNHISEQNNVRNDSDKDQAVS